MKVCNRCKESKSLDEFYKNRASKDGKTNMCKICDKQTTHKWQTTNPERMRETIDKWTKNNYERWRENISKHQSILENRLKGSIQTQYNKVIPKEYRHNIIEILGCDINTYIKYIESLWLKRFSWED